MLLDLRGRPFDPAGERPCDPKTFEGRRDAAMIRLLFDTGMRRGELANLRLNDLDLDLDVAVVHRGRRGE